MSTNTTRPCPCGSGKPSQWAYDGAGIPLCRTCNDCHDKKMSRYNPAVFNNPEYAASGDEADLDNDY